MCVYTVLLHETHFCMPSTHLEPCHQIVAYGTIHTCTYAQTTNFHRTCFPINAHLPAAADVSAAGGAASCSTAVSSSLHATPSAGGREGQTIQGACRHVHVHVCTTHTSTLDIQHSPRRTGCILGMTALHALSVTCLAASTSDGG